MTDTVPALTDRLAANETAQNAGVPARRASTIYDLLERQGPAIARALPRHLDADRFVRIALTQVRRTPKLAACDSASLLAAVMQLAQVGLEPDGRNAHLVPFGRECTPIIDYRGFMELARRSGQISDIYAEVVHEKDVFREVKGLHRDLVHEPSEDDDPGPLTHAYAVANFVTGGVAYAVLRRRDVMRRKAASKSAGRSDSMWQTNEDAAWRKSAVRALAPFLPYSPELAAAQDVDDRVEFGRTSPVLDVDEVADPETGEITEHAGQTS